MESRSWLFLRLVLLLALVFRSISTTEHQFQCQHGTCSAKVSKEKIQCFDSGTVFHSFANQCASIAHLNLVVIIRAWNLPVNYPRRQLSQQFIRYKHHSTAYIRDRRNFTRIFCFTPLFRCLPFSFLRPSVYDHHSHHLDIHCIAINLQIYGYAWCPFFKESRTLAKALAANYNVQYRTNTTGVPGGPLDNDADMNRYRNQVDIFRQ